MLSLIQISMPFDTGINDIIIPIRYSASVVMSLAYGKNPRSYYDPDVQSVNRCLTLLGLTMRPGLWMVDLYPILR